jgi:thymidylate synthase
MNNPIVINADTIEDAWSQAICCLNDNNWELWDLVVRIATPTVYSKNLHTRLTEYARKHNLIEPNQVSYTIFPHKLVRNGRPFDEICRGYLEKYYPMTRKAAHAGWGTYFHRMISYPTARNGQVRRINQLGHIIAEIRKSKRVLRTAYTLVIPVPGGENTKPLGTPCLNSIAIRQEPIGGNRVVSLLAIYRNHDFSQRAYGNYYGLSKLLEYIANETGSRCGSLTCVSSHAFTDKANATMRRELSLISKGEDAQ